MRPRGVRAGDFSDITGVSTPKKVGRGIVGRSVCIVISLEADDGGELVEGEYEASTGNG